jgi:hypothetical protein
MEDFSAIKDSFEKIYSGDAWGGGSGPGSLPSSTTLYRAFIEDFIYENNVKTVTDLGCGDWQFSRYINWSSVDYTGMEIVASLVERNNKNFSSAAIRFILSESVASLPGGDLLLCKEVLQHLPNDTIFDYLKETRKKYKFALITNSVAPGEVNGDIVAGQYRPLRIDLQPFNARGANVLTYFPYDPKKHQLWKNNVFLIVGDV